MLNTENTTPNNEQDTTQQQTELKRLLSEVQAATFPLAKAVRQNLQGHDVDWNAARMDAMQAVDSVISQVAPSAQRGPQSYTPGDLAALYWDRVAERKEYAGTGFPALNKVLIGGLDQDRLYTFLGAPGAGKTTLANQIADYVAGSKRAVLYVTSEDTPHTLLAKTIARRGKISYSAVLRGYPSERERITAALQEYQTTESARFLRYVDATQGITLDDIYEQALSHFKALEPHASGAPLLVVDYLQNLARDEHFGVDLRQSIALYTKRLHAMACDLHTSVLCLSAMNRASGYAVNNSVIASAKESGDVDYSSDTIMAIGRQEDAPEPEPGVRRYVLRIDKNRQGVNDVAIPFNWRADLQQFEEVDEDAPAPYIPGRNGNGAGARGRR